MPVKFPSRVILNLETISVYQTDDEKSFYSGFKLKDIKVLGRDKKEPDNCFIVGSTDRQLTMCGMIYSRTNIKKDIEEWIRDIKLFRDDCKIKIPKIFDIMTDPSVQTAINEAKRRRMIAKLKTNLQAQKKKEDPEDLQIRKAQLRAWRTMEKEKKFEERKLKEEELKERMDEDDIRKKMECEKNKKEKLLNAIILKKKANDIRKKLETRKEIDVINLEMKQRILKNRKMLEERLYRMKKESERKMNMARQRINDIHASLATNLISAEKKGDMKKCKPQTKERLRKRYCNENFNTSNMFYLLKDCLNEKQYCDVCCENEFGEAYLDQKEICKGQCDIKIEMEQSGGKWVWVDSKKKKEFILNTPKTTIEKVEINNDLPILNR